MLIVYIHSIAVSGKSLKKKPINLLRNMILSWPQVRYGLSKTYLHIINSNSHQAHTLWVKSEPAIWAMCQGCWWPACIDTNFKSLQPAKAAAATAAGKIRVHFLESDDMTEDASISVNKVTVWSDDTQKKIEAGNFLFSSPCITQALRGRYAHCPIHTSTPSSTGMNKLSKDTLTRFNIAVANAQDKISRPKSVESAMV